MGPSASFKKKKIMPPVKMEKHILAKMLSKAQQTQRDKIPHDLTFMWNLKFNFWKENVSYPELRVMAQISG